MVWFSEMGAVEGGETGLSRRLSEFLLDLLGYRGEDIQPYPPVVLLKPPQRYASLFSSLGGYKEMLEREHRFSDYAVGSF